MTGDKSPYLNGQPISDELAQEFQKIYRYRMSKQEYDELNHRKRNPKHKKMRMK